MKTLIKNGLLVDSNLTFNANVVIEDEKIVEITQSDNFQVDKVIDATDKYVIPGGIDAHTHLDMPMGNIKSSDDFYSGTVAAAFGGTTTIIDFPTQSRNESLQSALDIWHAKGKSSVIDYGFHMIITDPPKNLESEFINLKQNGITSIKLFMAYPNRLMIDDAQIYKIMRQAVKQDILVMLHAENGVLIEEIINEFIEHKHFAPINHALSRPGITEVEAINRGITISQLASASTYFVHVSTADGAELIKNARSKNLKVFGETCPHYLFLSLEDMGKEGFEDAKLVFTPPLREKWNLEKLWRAVNDGSIQVSATDHCPFCFNGQKDLGKDDFRKIPNGGAGIEHRLQLMYQGVLQNKITLNKWVEVCSVNPAKIFGMYPQKGAIDAGSDADIVVWNPNVEYVLSEKTAHMNIDYSMFEGMKIKGNAETVISRGEVIIDSGKLVGAKGRGKFIKRSISQPV